MTLVDGKFVGISELEVVKVAQLTEMQMFPGYLKKYFIEPKLSFFPFFSVFYLLFTAGLLLTSNVI